MTEDTDSQLFNLFQDARDPIQDQLFIDRVFETITQQRVNRRKILMIGLFIGLILIVLLNPWLLATTLVISAITSLLTQSLLTLVFSPFGYVLGVLMALLVLIKIR